MRAADVQDPVAVVTGAAGALGVSISRRLLDAGYVVVGLDLVPEVHKLKDALGSDRVVPFRADVTSEDDVTRLEAFVREEFGALDLLVNNAARDTKVTVASSDVSVDPVEELARFAPDAFLETLKVNTFGPLLMAQKFIPLLRKSQNASIVNIASFYGIRSPNPQLYVDGGIAIFKGPDYPVSKAALLSLTTYLAATLGSVSIRSNAVSPGGVDLGQPDSFVAAYSRGTPLLRMASASDVAAAVCFLASSEAAYITGHNLVVDGGRSVW